MRARLLPAISLGFLALTFTAATANAQAKSNVCKDGTTSSVAGRGACSGHGGVDAKATAAAKSAVRKADEKAESKAEKVAEKKADKAADRKADAIAARVDAKADKAADKKEDKREAKAEKAEEKGLADAAGATAQCKDGTYSHTRTHQGACGRHGGVSKFLK